MKATSKTAIYTACLFTALFQIPSQAATMIAKWDFNDSSNATTSVAAVGGYTGTFSGTGSRTASGQGRTGTAGDFAFRAVSSNGAMTSNTAPFLSALNTTMGTQTISITYWQYLTSLTNSTTFFATSTTVTDNNKGLSAHSPYSDGKAYFDTSGGTFSNTRLSAPLGATTNTWQLITWIYDNGAKSIYRNGTLVGSYTGVSLPLKTDINAFYVGNSHNLGEGFSGRIDDFTIWQGALTLSEINTLVIPESSTTAMIALLAIGAAVRRKRSCN
jgi:hypothetical protein